MHLVAIVVSNRASIVAILFNQLCKILAFIGGCSLSSNEGLDSIEQLGNGGGCTIFGEVGGRVDVVDIDAPSIKLGHFFNTFLVA
jgi:hypothetical protein